MKRSDPNRERPGNETQLSQVSLAEATLVWAKIGLLSFGGPSGQIALMHRILVDEKRWISENRFLHALNFCMVLPGPEAQQLATYVGWLLHRMRGGLIAGSLFVLPGLVVILGLSYIYVSIGSVPVIQAVFAGLKPAIIVIVLQAVLRIGSRSLNTPLLTTLAVLAFVAMYVFRIPFPYVILVAALVGAFNARLHRSSTAYSPNNTLTNEPIGSPPVRATDTGWVYTLRCVAVFGFLWLAPTAILAVVLGPDSVFTNIGTFFSKMAVVTFGGAYAVLTYVGQEAVNAHAWLKPGEMMDGLAMAETTPGPLIMVTQYVGFVAAYRNPGALPPGIAALFGGLLTTWVTFLPCFLWIFVGAPHIERLRHNQLLSGALAGVTAAVVGVIVNLAVWFAGHTLFGQVNLYRFAFANIELPDLGSLQISSLLITLIIALLVFRFRASIVTTLAVSTGLGLGTLLI